MQHKELSQRQHRLIKKIEGTQRKLEQTMSQRLLIGLLLTALLVGFSLTQWQVWSLSLGLTLFLYFAYLVKKTKNLKKFIQQLGQLRLFYLRTLERCLGSYQNVEFDISEYPSEVQTLAFDIHLTGNLSVLNLLDETLSDEGRSLLVKQLLNPKWNQQSIEDRHKLIRMLSSYWWSLIKLIVKSKTSSPIQLRRVHSEIDRPLLGPQFKFFFGLHILAFVFLWSGTIINLLSSQPINPVIFFVAYLFFALATRSQVAHSFQRSHDLAETLLPVKSLIEYIEKHREDKYLADHFKVTAHLQLGRELKNLERLTAFLSVQGHPMVHIVLNALCPWDYFFSYLSERWRLRMNNKIPEVISELATFEVVLSQTLFYCFQTQTFPTVNESHPIEFKNLMHPLLPRDHAVANSFSFPTDKKLILITGSNMSGKSTFLRTFGVNHQLALSGCPIFADQFNTHLSPLRSCLKVHDSLEQGLSTFYYEVKQVASMIQLARSGEKFIYLIDEIFRGTNNKERLIGSQAVIRELLKYDLNGFISTHDLELTQLADDYPEILNQHFRDDVGDRELVFNYKIQPGPCPTTNALKIIEREGIPIDSSVST